jgi:hypothetical protein
MTVVAAGGVDSAQRVQLGMPDLAVATDRDTQRLLAYVNFSDGVSETVRASCCGKAMHVACSAQ